MVNPEIVLQDIVNSVVFNRILCKIERVIPILFIEFRHERGMY
jgi:hypothetical protein